MEDHRDLRERLLRAASELLDSAGVEAVTIRAVARMSQVSHGAPRRHFRSRALLLAALAHAGFDDLAVRLDALPAHDPHDRLALAGTAYLEFARQRPALFELMTRHDVLEGSGADLRSTSLAAVSRWTDLVAAARPESSATDALLLLAGVHGLASLHSRGALDALGQDPAALLQALLRR